MSSLRRRGLQLAHKQDRARWRPRRGSAFGLKAYGERVVNEAGRRVVLPPGHRGWRRMRDQPQRNRWCAAWPEQAELEAAPRRRPEGHRGDNHAVSAEVYGDREGRGTFRACALIGGGPSTPM